MEKPYRRSYSLGSFLMSGIDSKVQRLYVFLGIHSLSRTGVLMIFSRKRSILRSRRPKPMYFKFLTLIAFHAFMELKVNCLVIIALSSDSNWWWWEILGWRRYLRSGDWWHVRQYKPCPEASCYWRLGPGIWPCICTGKDARGNWMAKGRNL